MRRAENITACCQSAQALGALSCSRMMSATQSSAPSSKMVFWSCVYVRVRNPNPGKSRSRVLERASGLLKLLPADACAPANTDSPLSVIGQDRLGFFQHDLDAVDGLGHSLANGLNRSRAHFTGRLQSPVGSRSRRILSANSQFFGALDRPCDQPGGRCFKIASDLKGVSDRDLRRVAHSMQHFGARLFGAAEYPEHDPLGRFEQNRAH